MLLGQLQKTLRINASSNTPAACDATVLIIRCDDTISGGISFSGTVQVDGRVEGDIRCKRLVVTAHAFIDGTIAARTAHIEGTVNGPIDAARVFLAPTAVVKGNITYEALNIATGASISGICRDCGQTRVRSLDGASTEGTPPLPFSLAKATCGKSSVNIAPVPPLRLARSRRATSMKAVWEHYQQSARTIRQ